MLINDIIMDILYVLGTLLGLLYAYHVLYMIIGFFHKPKLFEKADKNRFAVLISARNEESVIRDLLNTINNQSYPAELIDIYVIADNCTDKTADIARECGAIVYERFNKEKVGKGYALETLYDYIFETRGNDYYDGYFVFDADNLLEPDFIEEMNKTFSAGYKVVTSYRNSKNFGSNWISAGYAIWFLREARYLNNSRMILGTGCAISGTGFLVHRDVINKTNGWKYFLLTEDIEFTIANLIKGEKVGYCHTAMLYDEQPEDFMQSWNQRLRWAKGMLQVFFKYGGKLVAGIFKGPHRVACYDLTMTILPLMIITIVTVLMNIVLIANDVVLGATTGDFTEIFRFVMTLAAGVGGGYMSMFLLALLVTVTEWKAINTTTFRKILYLFTFPIYMATYIPIGFVALFKNVEWTPIRHTVSTNLDALKEKGNTKKK